MDGDLKVSMIEASESPSNQLIAAAAAEVIVTDSAGHAITLKKPGVLAQFKMIEMLGPVASANTTFVQMVLPVMFVAAIDGDPISKITTRNQLDALIQRLDEAGIEAVMKSVPEHFSGPNPEADKAAVKN